MNVKSRIGYGIGDLANNLLFQMSVLYLLFFYTDIAGIAPGVVGIIFLIARIWDAVNDPMMGILIDRTKSRHGRSRVYLRYASLPLALATVLLFLVPSWNESAKIIYAGVTYILWGMLYTMISIPYASMTAELSSDPEERTRLSSVRMLFMLGGVIIVSVATEPLTALFSEAKQGYFWTAVIYGGLAFFFYQICFKATAKSNEPVADETRKTNQAPSLILREVFKNRPLLILTLAFLIGATSEYMREASIIYFVTYNMGNSSLMPVVMGVVVLSMVAGNLLIPPVSRKLDKKGTYMAGGIIGIAGSILFHFIPHTNVVAVLVSAAVSSLGFTVVSTLGWAMLPDTVEYGEMVTGERAEGVVYSFFSFSQKLATALAGGIVALILQLSRYNPDLNIQNPDAELGILSTITLIPMICLGISMIILHFYPLDKKRFNEIKKSLKEKKHSES